MATFSTLSIDKVGTGYTLTAVSGVLTPATSAAFNITVGAASQVAFTAQPTAVLAGAVVTPPVQVTVQDALGNTITSSTASITLSITTGTGTPGAVLGGTLTRAAAGGTATFDDLTVDQPGTGYTLTASATGLGSGVSAAFTVVSAEVARYELDGNGLDASGNGRRGPERPEWTVVIGGIVTSTLLTLIVLPTLYEVIERRAARRIA